MTLVARIRGDIERRIRSGEWRPGDRIPFEHEIVAAYACSRATVSKALEAMAEAGLIERRRKAGSFVARPHVQAMMLAVPDLAQLIAARGEAYRWQLLARSTSSTTDGEISGPTLSVEGLHHAGPEPIGIEYRLIGLTAVPVAAAEDFAAVAPGTWLLDHVPWTDARHRITAVSATRRQASLLEVAPRAACLQMERWTWRQGDPVTYARQIFRGDRYDLVAEFKPGDSQ